MRLLISSHRVFAFGGIAQVLLVAGLTSCVFLVGPGSIKVADPTRAVADARKLIADERENPSRPLRGPEEMPQSLRIPGLLWANIDKDHVDLVIAHNPDITRGARIWNSDAKREHKDTPTKYPDVYFFDYNNDAPDAADNIP